MPARDPAVRDQPRMFHPVGARQRRDQRQPLDRQHRRVAGQGGDMDHLARAIGAAVGCQEHVHRPRRRAPLDPAVGEIEGRIGQREESEVIRAVPRQHQRGLRRPRAARQAGGEAGPAVRIGRGRAQHLVRAGDQRQFDPFARRGVRQGTHVQRQPVRPLETGQAQVRQHEPLGRARLFPPVAVGVAGRQRVDAGGQARQNLAQRQAGGDIAVQLHPHLARAGPDLARDAVGEGVFLPCGQRAAEPALLHHAGQVAVRHLAQAQLDPGQVDRLDRDRRFGRFRQDIGAAREPDLRAAVAHVLGQRDVLRQHLARGGGQALAQRDTVARPVIHAVETQRRSLDRDRQRRIRALHEGVVVDTRRDQVFREIGADARCGAVAFDAGARDAEPVEPDRPVQRRGDILARGLGAGQPQRRDHLAVAALAFQRIGHRHQRPGADGGHGAPQVAVQRRQFRAAQPALVLLVPGGGKAQHAPGVIGPEIGAVGQRDRHAQPAQRRRTVRSGKRGQDIVQRNARRGRLERQIAGKIGGLRQVGRRDPGQLRGQRIGAGARVGVDRHDLGRDRAGIGRALGDRRFRETGVRPRVEGEGPAGRIQQAGPRAGLQVGVEDRVQVRSVEIHVAGDDQSAVRQRPLRRQQRRGQEPGGQRTEETGHRITPSL